MGTALAESGVRLELQHLLSGLCDDQLSATEHERLEFLLNSDSDCRKIYLQYMDLHSVLLLAARENTFMPCGVHEEFLCEVGKKATVAQGSPPSEAAGPKSVAPPSNRAAIAYRYLLVAVFAVAVTLAVQVVSWRISESGNFKDLPARTGTPGNKKNDKDDFVATLRDAVDCVWEKPAQALTIGSRLSPGDLELPKGIAYVQFDSGPEIVVEGPAALRVESSTAVTVLSGKVVLRADESAAPFDLYTPNSTLAETGTEFAVSVNRDVEEIHVFSGEVQRTPKLKHFGGKPEHLKAGEARHYAKAMEFGKPTKFDPKKFVRHVASRPGQEVNGGLIAYDGFDYRTANALVSGKANGGKGWFGPWKAGFTRAAFENGTPWYALNPRENLFRPGSAVPSVGGSFDYSGFATASRRLAKSVRMDADATYFLSFLVRRSGPQSDPFNSAGIQLWTHDDIMQQKFENARQRLFVGIKKDNQLAARLQKMDAQIPITMIDGATQLLVAKIVASRSGSDQVFVRVYAPSDPVNSSEPTRWSLTSSQFQSDLTFDWLQLHINSKTRQTIDEVRLGTTWSSVTAAFQKRQRI